MEDTGLNKIPDITEQKMLEEVFAIEYARLCTLANRILQDEHYAQDAVQEAWIRLYRAAVHKKLDLSDRNKLRHLAMIAVKNSALNLYKKVHRYTMASYDEIENFWTLQASLDEHIEKQDKIRLMLKKLAQLTEQDKSILLLKYGRGCSSEQIATILGLRASTVRQRLKRLRNKMQKDLQKEDMYGH